MTSSADACVCPLVKSTGKPDAGNPHVRFDEGEGNALPTLLAIFGLKSGKRRVTIAIIQFYLSS